MSQKSHRVWPAPDAHPPSVVDASLPPDVARWARLQARDVMKSDLVTVETSCPLDEVERLLAERGISGVPVVDGSGAIVGVVSAKDLLDRYSEDPDARPRRGRDVDAFPSDDEPLDPDEEPAFASRDLDAQETAADVMTPEVRWVSADAGLGEIARAMVRDRVHRLLVRDEGRYVGLVGTMDVLHALAG
jgi:CBS domain-containing protein